MRLHRFRAALRSSGASTARMLRRRLARRPDLSETFEQDLAPDPYRWQTVTILAEPEQVAPDGRLPAPLAELADTVETRIRPAPAGRGTQLSARTRPGPARQGSAKPAASMTEASTSELSASGSTGPGLVTAEPTGPGLAPAGPTGPDSSGWKGHDPARQIRMALQQARQLVETGEVLAVEPQPAGRRRPARGLLVDLMAGNADQEGVV